MCITRTENTEVICKQVQLQIILIAMILLLCSINGCNNIDSPEKGARLWINSALNPNAQVFGQRTASSSWNDSKQDVMMEGAFNRIIMEFNVFVTGIRVLDDVYQATKEFTDFDRYVYQLDGLHYKAQEYGQAVLVTVSGTVHVYDDNEEKNIGASSLFPVKLRMIKESGVWKCDSWLWRADKRKRTYLQNKG